MKIPVLRFEPLAFALFVLVCVSPVWAFDYFVTSDGPCHLYNSRIIWDWWSSHNRDFTHPFYSLHTELEPNWMFNLVTAPLLGLFGPEVAEKTFFTLYIVLFCYGFRFLIGQINANAKFLSYIGVLFGYHRLLMAGFLNNSLSLALWFWVVGWWWKNRNDTRPRTLLVGAFLTLCLYFSHPMGFTYACMSVGCLLLGELVFEQRQYDWKSAWTHFLTRAWAALLCALPSLLLFFAFLLRHNWSEASGSTDVDMLLNDIAHLTPLQTLSKQERGWALGLAIGIACLWLFAWVQRLRRPQWHPTDGILLLLLVVLYTTFFPLQGISGGLEVSTRMSMIPFFAVLLYCATVPFPVWIQKAVMWLAPICAVGWMWVRIPVHRAASAYAEEVVSCVPYIHDRSTLLTLNYDWAGFDPDGHPISDRAWLFTHVDCYLGTDKTMVISDNYETHFSYFPVHARWETDMYQHTRVEGIDFDHRPPRADIAGYHSRTGQYLDYVLLLCYTPTYEAHPYTQEIRAQLEKGYDKIFTSVHGRAILYKMKAKEGL